MSAVAVYLNRRGELVVAVEAGKIEVPLLPEEMRGLANALVLGAAELELDAGAIAAAALQRACTFGRPN